MAWKVKLGGDKEVALDDLPPALFDMLAQDDPQATWWTIYAFPGGTTERLYRVIEAAAQHAGVDPPARPTTVKQVLGLVDMLEQVDDIEDAPMQDGFPTTPGEPEPGSSSGAPGSLDGPPMLSDDNESVTS